MAKQWGHGFHKGREAAINELLCSIEKNIKDPGRSAVHMRQAGGKYCIFKCPICLKEAHFKMTASSGWCEACGTYFQNFEQTHAMKVQPGLTYNDAIGTVEFQRAPSHAL